MSGHASDNGGAAACAGGAHKIQDDDAPKIPDCYSNDFLLVCPLPLLLLLLASPERVVRPAPIPDSEPVAGWPAELRSG